jgi:hypothetical protein
MNNVSINPSQRLFVINHGSGFTCLGFDVATKRIRQYAELLAVAVRDFVVGSLEQYAEYLRLESAVAQKNFLTPLYEPGTLPEVQRILESCRASRTRVRIFYGSPATGRDALEEYDTTGYVGCSMGPIRIPLLVVPRKAYGGSLSSDRVLRIVALPKGTVLYQHPQYQVPALQVVTPDTPQAAGVEFQGYPAVVTAADRGLIARFSKVSSAENYVAFLRGERHRK